jgi:biotin carboxylase
MKDIILFVNAIRPATFEALERHEAATGEHFTPIVIVDGKIQANIEERNGQQGHLKKVKRLSADFDSAGSIRSALAPYQDRIFAITSQYENSILELKKLIPYAPYLPMPTESSLDWATEKRDMRQLMRAYNPELVPAYLQVTDASRETIRAIERTMKYPVVVKPSGLEGSLLVSLANNAKELALAINRTLAEMQLSYDKWIKRQEPVLLVEEFMQGRMYSIDVYVSASDECRFTPPVRIVTGRQVGFEDFFGYIQFAPARLNADEIKLANRAAAESCRALGLRSVTAHVELMRTPTGWKIIELGPRIGGFRHEIYTLSYGLNHIMNDILNRGGREPIIPKRAVSHAAYVKVHAPEEGILNSIHGLNEVKSLRSFKQANQLYQIGEAVSFAKNGADPVITFVMAHKSKRQYDADIRRLEQVLRFDVNVLEFA